MKKQSTRHSNFIKHTKIFHNVHWNLDHYAKINLMSLTNWRLIYLGDNIWLLLGDGNLPARSQKPQTKCLSWKTKIESYLLVFHWEWSNLSFITDLLQPTCSPLCLFMKITENDLAAHIKSLFSYLFLLLIVISRVFL